MMLFKGWPPQYFWAMRKGGGGGGSSSIVVVPTADDEERITKTFNESTEWVVNNPTGYPMFVQTFKDDDGTEVFLDVIG